MIKISTRTNSSIANLVISIHLLLTACNHLSNNKSPMIEQSREEIQTQRRENNNSYGNRTIQTGRTRQSIFHWRENDSRHVSENNETENRLSMTRSEKIISCCCSCCIATDEEIEEEEEIEENEHFIQKKPKLNNDNNNPLRPILEYASSGHKMAYINTENENYKITISHCHTIPLERELFFWKNRITRDNQTLLPPIPLIRRDLFSPPNDNRFLSYIQPTTCKEFSSPSFARKNSNVEGENSLSKAEEPGFFAKLSTLIFPPELPAQNYFTTFFFENGLNESVIDSALKPEKAHYTFSLLSRKNKILEDYSPPTLLEAIRIIEQDSLLSEPKLSNKKLYTSASYTVESSTSSIAVCYTPTNGSYTFSLTNPRATEQGITLLSVQQIDENPSESVCFGECSSPIFCFGECCIRPKHFCYFCHCPKICYCGKIKVKGLNCSIGNCLCCYCPNLPCCVYPTSSTWIDRCGCMCCSVCCCCFTTYSIPLIERCGYYCCLCNSKCTCGK